VILKLNVVYYSVKVWNLRMRLLCLSLLLLLTPMSYASTVKLNYSVFFGYMKTLYKLDYDYVTTAFYLVDRDLHRPCIINNAQIQVDEVREPILFQTNGRLLPFYSDKHRQDGGMLIIDIKDNKTVSRCDLQVTVMAKERELAQLTPTTLTAINDQLEGVIRKNAGMIGKYFLPPFQGMRLHLRTPLTDKQQAALSSITWTQDKQQILLTSKDVDKIQQLNELNIVITRITPWLSTN